MSDKGRVIGGGGLKQDVVEASFQVQHANLLCPPKLSSVPPCIVELIIILGHLFVERDNILTHLVGLPGLDAWD